ncbi:MULTISPECIES: deoxyribose-phosphate aldolase [unclassified Breznakia]|uniref:deoxyribose-phosphate aldolase n=1 Tax=unclassified Breznakia TaxID=2623764 RepID=UPI002476759B|nr:MULTISPECIES: deoxyribose-phosphate aldolase [unclassified Breznakia]MDH6366226.1 deoxyribose-phosphate aldolase [Breznakia sp. PH1-1]MDH6403319.1 deoxyribose-phosphate aldolase [Breznakia sp. PF1-11]MDH6411028.1 deoxyribose-phosphate aldolase [Breznakia sp. PFB1-11]MDH6413392.1 deoxyribose-phosphate aldolase [Breznakia sp. PFB1-14]MDH6416157.1 deoxyribose-phosphate aldolase [Breznakia sp. PFB1-4]
MKMNKLIDHTLLKADATRDQIAKLCQEAKEYDFMSVCVNSYWVPFCVEQLAGTDVKVCTVVGFPLGAMSTAAKAWETKVAIEQGAKEVDMVLNIGELKGKNYDVVREDVRAVVEAAKGNTVKVILETCLLTDEEIIKASELCVEAGAHFVKTSTGFSTEGANPRVVKLMKDTVGDKAEVKAAGGVRSAEDVEKMVEAGATRIGTSSGIKLVVGEKVTGGY